ncbi:MAG: ABC transporter ATP-binding protein [Desulfatibacillaceae bacterium]
MILEVDGVQFAYNGIRILDNVRFEVNRGEVLVILGPNGAGKTTLLKCVNTILKPSGGTVWIEGDDVSRLRSMQVARRVGYVAQSQTAGRMTAFDAILLGRRPHIRYQVSQQDLRVVDGAIRSLGLETLAMRHTDSMSGGELQKVAIGRALVQEPRLLLLDEPTSSLDMKNQMDILGLVRRVVREHGVSAVLTMHDINTALQFADKALFLKDGTVHFCGTPDDVRAGTVEEVYGIPVEVHRHRGRPYVFPHVAA